VVQVELFAQLGEGVERRRVLELAQPASVREVAARVGLDPEAVGLILMDGLVHGLDDPVPATCRLCFFPPVSGG
jgi:molybdopterin converting factor small subunit